MSTLLVLLLAPGCRDAPPEPAEPPVSAPADAPARECVPEAVRKDVLFDRLLRGQLDACHAQALDRYIQARGEENGPWKQELRVARSADGQHFEAVDGALLSKAAVPEVVLHEGRYYLFHVDGDLDHMRSWVAESPERLHRQGVPGLGALALAVSDDGLTFRQEPSFEVVGLVRGMAVDPDVVRLPDGRWRMYYLGVPHQEYVEGAWDEGTPHKVFTAVSDDLIRWTQEGLAVEGPYADPSVVCEGEVCEMLSFGLDRATSDDGGATFTFQGPLQIPGFAPDAMRLPDGSVRFVYNEKSPGAPLRSLVDDGGGWRREPGERMPATYGEAPSFARAPGGGWLMYFHTFTDPSAIPSRDPKK